jgi:cell division protein FtsZ
VSAEPELRPVPASIFDDEFFRASQERPVPSYVVSEESVRVETGVRESAYFQQVENVQPDVPATEVGGRAPFGGVAAPVVDANEPDELDIPAFLRRGH